MGYLIFGDRLHDCTDIFDMFRLHGQIDVGSVAVGFVNIVKMPLIMIPTRGLFLELCAEFNTVSVELATEDDLESSLLRVDRRSNPSKLTKHCVSV